MGLLSTFGAASGRAFGLTRVGAAIKDAYFNLTTLLLPGNGTNGAQNNTFLDSSTNNFTITRNGNTTQGTFSPFSQTGWSNFFDGTNDNITLNTNAVPATGEFCLEAFVFQSSSAGSSGDQHIFSQYTSGSTGGRWYLRFNSTTVAFTSGLGSVNGSTTVGSNVWYHICLTRDSGNRFRLFVNGVLDGTSVISGSLDTAASKIGSTSTANYWQGYISNVRVTSGSIPTSYQTSSTTVGASIFTSPTAALTTSTQGATSGDVSLLTCQSNRFVDNSTASVKTLTLGDAPSVQAFSPFAPTAAYSAATNGGSGYFDGTGDFLNFTGSSATNFNGTDWTVETWVYLNGAPTDYLNIIQSTTGANNWIPYLSVGFRSTYELNIALNAANNQSTQKAVPYAWNHIAVVRSGGVVKVYLNGATTSISVTVDINNSNLSFYFGKADNTPGGGSAFAFLNGYMCGTRFTKTAVYTAAFTPPTSPPTTTNAQLLLNFTNAGITDATAKNDLETVGNAQISTTQSKFGGSSMYFDGTGDSIVANSGARTLEMLTGDFTIECWIRFASVGNGQIISGLTGANTLYWQYYTSQLQFGQNNVGSIAATNWSPSANTWYHVAVTRSGTTVRQFVDGVQLGSNATSSASFANGPVSIGTGGAGDLNGFIDDLRVTKGYARYTAAFTPPTAAFALQ